MDDNSSILLEGRPDCREAAKTLSLLATENRNTDIRIVAHDTRVAGNQGHYLIHLAQRLPSFVQIRTTVTREHRNFRESWLIVDDGAFMRIRNPERFEGYYELDNKLDCKSYYDEFVEVWEACAPDQNTRRLSL